MSSTLCDWTLTDFRSSAVPDTLTLANVESVEGDRAIETLAGPSLDKLGGHSQQYATGPVRAILDRYQFAAAGLWVTYGATLDGIGGAVAYAKPRTPRPNPHKLGKVIKYETPASATASPILPIVPDEYAAAIYARYGVEASGEPFWAIVARHPHIPVAIVEGFKKALALIAQGIPAIAIRGITQWHLKGGVELHPELARFATKARQIYVVFDQDTKKKTIAAVNVQARKLGTVLEGKGCKVMLPTWHPDQGKGIDDVLYAVGDEAQTTLDQILADSPTLKEYKRSAQAYAALKAIERLNALTLPIERDTEGEYLPELPELQPGAIHVVDANMNSGKTYRIGRDWVQRALAAGHHVLVLSPLNALGKQTAKDWGISHIHDQGVTASEQKAFWTALQNRPGVVLCPDSIAKLPQWFWSKPVLLVLDEANQVTEHMCQGNTLKSRYSAVNERLADAARYAIESGGAVVLSEDGIPDRAVKFWQSVSGAESVRCIRHRKQGVPWDCTVYGGSVTLFRARLLSATKQQRILFVTSSQREAKRLHRILEGTGCKVTRIDSETNQQGAFNDFFKAPTEWLQTHRPDVLILSPSAKSGVSIEGGVTAEDAYFDQVWGYFPSLATDTHMQLLGRYRPSVPRLMFMPPFILGSGDESLFTPKAVKQRLQRNLDTVAHLFNCDTDPVAAGLELAILDYLSEALAVSGSQKRIPQPAIITRLEAAGHVVDIEKLEGSDKGISKLWRETQEQIWQDEAQEIAHLTIADDLDKDWARETLDSMESTRENRLIAHKVLWRDEFPGVMFDDLDECYQALCNNYGTMRRGVILQARAENLDATKDGERDAIERNLNGRVRAAHRLPTAYIKAGIIAQMGVLALLDGKSWSNTDKRAIAIKTKALKYRDEIRYYLRLNIKPDQTPSEIANKLIRKLGLETLSISRPGARDAKRDRLYLVEDADNPVRARLLEALRGKLSDSVSTICNKDSELLQIVDTGPPSPPPQGIEGGCWLLGDVVRVASTGVTALIEDITRGLATLGTEAGEILQAPLADLIAT